MTFLLAAAAVTASGWALLRALRLSATHLAVDLPLAWLLGAAWLGGWSLGIRALLGVSPGPVIEAVVLLAPAAAWVVRRRISPAAPRPGAPVSPAPAPRWRPRPAWLLGPMIAWTLLVAGTVGLHGLSTPVHTDDAYRVRAYAPVLAVTGAWNEPARAVVAMAGPIPTWVPSLAWIFGAEVDPVHVSATILLTFLALLVLLVGLGSIRGEPEAGWGAAFALASMPFLAYHASSTYADAWLGAYVAAALAFLVAYGRSGAPDDALRSLLLLLGAAMVKREGGLVALPVAAVLIAQVAWRERTWRGTLLGFAPVLVAWLVFEAARVAAVGTGGAFQFLLAAGSKVANGAPAGAAVATAPSGYAVSPGTVFLRALFLQGTLGILWWVVAASVVVLPARVRREGLAPALVALALLLAEAAVSAIWIYPEFTVNEGTVHRSLLPVSAAAAVWIAALLAPPARPEAEARATAKARPRRRGG
jgi:hypothetical protein